MANHRRLLGIAVPLVASALALSGCSGHPSSQSKAAGTRSAAPAVHAQPVAARPPAAQRCAQHLEMGLAMAQPTSPLAQQVHVFAKAVRRQQPETKLFRVEFQAYKQAVALHGRAATMQQHRFQVAGLVRACRSAGA